MQYTDKQLEYLWKELSDVPFNENDDGELVLANAWLEFQAGTDREEIWHWFDDRYGNGVYSLMFPEKQ